MKSPLQSLPWLALATAISLPWLTGSLQAQQGTGSHGQANPRLTQSPQAPPCTTSTCPDGCTTVVATLNPVTVTARAGNLPKSIGIDQFNPAFGTLQRVEILFSANTINRRYQFTNLAQAAVANQNPCTPGLFVDPNQVNPGCPIRVGGDLTASVPGQPGIFAPALESGEYVKFTHWPAPLLGDIFPTIAGNQTAILGGNGVIPQLNDSGECPATNIAPIQANLSSCTGAMDSGKGRTFTNTFGEIFAWRNCWDNEPNITDTVCLTSNLGAYIGTCGSTAPCCFTPGGSPTCSTQWPVSLTDQSLNQVNDAGLTSTGQGCGQYNHGLFAELTLTVTVRYFYCPANLPPQTQPDIATVCRNVTGACPSFVDIPVLANDCDPVTCPGSTTSGRINCGSVVITGNPANGTVSIQGCTGTSTNQGCPQTNNCAGCFVRYTPNANFVGTDSFCYTVADNEGKVSCSTPVSIRVRPAPNANDDTFDTCRGTPITIKPLANDTGAPAVAAATPPACSQVNPPNPLCGSPGFPCPTQAGQTTCVPQPLQLPALTATTIDCTSLSILTQPTNGTLSINQACTGTVGTCTACTGNNCVIYTPNQGFCGTDTFTYKVNDSSGCCDTATVTIRVFAPPTANDDCIELCEDASCEADNCVLIPIIANDTQGTCGSLPTSAINCNSVTITAALNPPSAGTITIGQNCGAIGNGGCSSACIRFCPAPGFRGVATFKYRIADSRTVNASVCQSNPFPCLSNEATVSLFVRCAPDAVDDVFCDPNPNDLVPLVIPVLNNDTFVRAGGDSASCLEAGVTFNTPPIEIVAGGTTGCQGPTKGTAEVFLDTDNVWKIRYTPTVVLGPTGQDFIQYRLKNVYTNLANCLPATPLSCCDTACVTIKFCPCPERPRNDCASLLLYPDVEVGTAGKTLLSITDACCENNVANTRVEFRFINSVDCTKSDFTYVLTPCDTLTLDVNSLGLPSGWKGYAYAYAKSSTTNAANPTGIPIVWNHLIGQSLRIDGATGLSYAINPIAFRGHGTAEGALNDDDNDGIRDFNAADDTGVPSPAATWEYDPLPDAIVIPRFMAQPPSGDNTSSSLILIALSGGRRFTTTVEIQGFNDNENGFSAEHTFYCWTKQPLSTIAGGTTHSNMSILDDADEIVGWPNVVGPPSTRLSAGWMRIKGKQAVSDSAPFETILDPAIYAVLIESREGRLVADLPYEECSQVNGSLLPADALGDGDPTPANGDNQ